MKKTPLSKTTDIKRWMFEPTWKIQPLPENPAAPVEGLTVVVYTNPQPGALEQAVIQRLQEKNRVLLLDIKARQQHDSDLEKLVQQQPVDVILNCAGLDEHRSLDVPLQQQLADLDHAKEHYFYSQLTIFKTLAACNVSLPTRYHFLMQDALGVRPTDTIDPYKQLGLGVVRVVPQEFPYFFCKAIEVTAGEVEYTSRRIMDELADVTEGGTIALRGADRHVFGFDAIEPAPPTMHLKKAGTYLITGGRGRIGYTLARHIAEHHQSNLVLTGISELPPRELWDHLENFDEHIQGEIQKVLELEALGSRVLLVQCDAANLEESRNLFERIQSEFGALDGVVHAAGIFEAQRAFRGIIDTSIEDCERRFLPKINGSLVLQELLHEFQWTPDFCFMQSSLSSVLGGFGFAAYSAGNIFMDAFAEVRRGSTCWMSINWDGWVFRDVDEEVENMSVISPQFASPSFGVVAEIAIRPQEGAAAYQWMLDAGRRSQTLVSTADLHLRYHDWVRHASHHQQLQRQPSTAPLDVLGGVMQAFREVIGDVPVQPDSNYFALGGDSLMAIELISLLSQRFHCAVDIIAILEHPTPQQIAQHIMEQQAQTVALLTH